MEWYLQTRTNTPINYKTILPLQASRPSSTAPKADPRALPHNHRRFHPLSSNPLRSPIDSSTVPPPLPRPPPIYRLSYQRISPPAPPFYTSTTNFWSPAFPCNLENDRAELRASQIFDTRKPGKKRTRSFHIEADWADDEQPPTMKTEIVRQKNETTVNRWNERIRMDERGVCWM